jgi:hypothetical protein
MGITSDVFSYANVEISMSITASDLLVPQDRVPLGLLFKKFYNLEGLNDDELNNFSS